MGRRDNSAINQQGPGVARASFVDTMVNRLALFNPKPPPPHEIETLLEIEKYLFVRFHGLRDRDKNDL